MTKPRIIKYSRILCDDTLCNLGDDMPLNLSDPASRKALHAALVAALNETAAGRWAKQQMEEARYREEHPDYEDGEEGLDDYDMYGPEDEPEMPYEEDEEDAYDDGDELEEDYPDEEPVRLRYSRLDSERLTPNRPYEREQLRMGKVVQYALAKGLTYPQAMLELSFASHEYRPGRGVLPADPCNPFGLGDRYATGADDGRRSRTYKMPGDYAQKYQRMTTHPVPKPVYGPVVSRMIDQALNGGMTPPADPDQWQG